MSALLDLGCNISASSQPCWLWTGPHNLNWLWPIYPVTVCSEFRVSVYRQTPSACLKSEVKGRLCQQPRTSVQSYMVGFFPPSSELFAVLVVYRYFLLFSH